ncbi:MAG: L,D-transpeptidase family protein [Erythrobacter sp.]
MKRAIAFIVLLCGSCVGPAADRSSDRAGAGVSAGEYGQRYTSRSSGEVGQRLADYLIVDKSSRLLVAYNNGRPLRIYRGLQFGDAPAGHKRFQGDERTPEGVYTVHTRNPNSSYHLSLRIDYPNSSDRAFASQYGRSPGGDIFIHGQPNGATRRMRGDWTDGCIALSNAEIEELWRLVPDGTPIEIRP